MAEQGKTNAMRELERQGIAYTPHTIAWDGKIPPDAQTAARLLNTEPGRVFKTLVTRGASGAYYVFDVPGDGELDLKKAARAVQEKSIAMLHLKQLFPLTGYVHGGCSPLGMKKKFPTVFDETCILYSTIFVSAGKIGVQMEIAPDDILRAAEAETADLLREETGRT